MINLKTLDLNLLMTLDVLLAEHNVTRAAERLHLSQPAVSVHLSKLRSIFNDPLLVPNSRGMKPTTLADELRQPLRNAIDALERVVTSNLIFNPTDTEQTWRIAASDYTESIILHTAIDSLHQHAPHSRLAILPLSPKRLSKQMERGEIDLAFHIRACSPLELRSRTLFTDRYVLAGRTGHPAFEHPITIESFCQLSHVIVSPDGGGFWGDTDDALKNIGITRHVALSVPHFLFMHAVLRNSDLVGMVPERLVQHQDGLTTVDVPITLPTFDIMMLWHERSHRDPAHQWLRAQIVSAVG